MICSEFGLSVYSVYSVYSVRSAEVVFLFMEALH